MKKTIKVVLAVLLLSGVSQVGVAEDKIKFHQINTDDRPIIIKPAVYAKRGENVVTKSILTSNQVDAMWAALTPLLDKPACATNYHIVALHFIVSGSTNDSATITTIWQADEDELSPRGIRGNTGRKSNRNR